MCAPRPKASGVSKYSTAPPLVSQSIVRRKRRLPLVKIYVLHICTRGCILWLLLLFLLFLRFLWGGDGGETGRWATCIMCTRREQSMATDCISAFCCTRRREDLIFVDYLCIRTLSGWLSLFPCFFELGKLVAAKSYPFVLWLTFIVVLFLFFEPPKKSCSDVSVDVAYLTCAFLSGKEYVRLLPRKKVFVPASQGLL